MNQRAQSVANVLLHKLERKSDYQLRYEILELIKELPIYCSKRFKVGASDYNMLFDILYRELNIIAYMAWKDVKQFKVTAEYRMRGRANNMTMTITTYERDMFEARQRIKDQEYINKETGRRFKPEFIGIEVKEITATRVAI